MKKPKIGIVSNILIMDTGIMPGLYRSYVNHDYVESLEKAGCIPVLLPVISNLEDAKEQIAWLDGILLSGGYDIDPALYDEQPSPALGFTMLEVDRYYMAAIHAADQLGIPIFGICKGIQAINIAFGGTVYQDMYSEKTGCLQHVQKAPRYNPTHRIVTEQDSFLGKVLGEEVTVNSFHHQSVKKVAEGFRVTAKASDGIVEAIEREKGSFICGVQWHPEMMAKFNDEVMLGLFRAFADKCRK